MGTSSLRSPGFHPCSSSCSLHCCFFSFFRSTSRPSDSSFFSFAFFLSLLWQSIGTNRFAPTVPVVSSLQPCVFAVFVVVVCSSAVCLHSPSPLASNHKDEAPAVACSTLVAFSPSLLPLTAAGPIIRFFSTPPSLFFPSYSTCNPGTPFRPILPTVFRCRAGGWCE